MVTLTVDEEAICQKLVESGFDDLADIMRTQYVGQHELFDELKNADLDTLYGPAPRTARNAMRKAISKGDRALVSSLHALCLSFGRTV